MTIQITPNAMPYLRQQVGVLSNVSDYEFPALYNTYIEERFAEIAPHLPRGKQGIKILDVGSGMGGINIPLYHKFKRAHIMLLDGEYDDPMMVKHNQTFSNFEVAKELLVANGIPEVDIHNWWDTDNRSGIDLVISLRAWCFHFPPRHDGLLEAISTYVRPGTRVITEFRTNRPEWVAEMQAAGLTLKHPTPDKLNGDGKVVLTAWNWT